jgi:threonine/homoserine/homoserine lactone efflux protein
MAVCGSGQATLSNDKQPGRRGKLHFFHMLDNLLPLALFAIAGSFTPGPNNVMVTASGQAFGFARSLPHMAGVTLGFAVLLIAFGLGLGQIFALYPGLHAALRIAGVIYLLYLAWRIATAGDPAAAGGAARPLTFLEAALFQWVNVKGLVVAASVVTAFTTGGAQINKELAVIVAVFALATTGSVVVYCLFGVAIGRLLKSERSRRIFNYSMAALVALSVGLLFV